MWEDGFCRTRPVEDDAVEDPVRKAFSKMSIQLYNYGEGWVCLALYNMSFFFLFKEIYTNLSNYAYTCGCIYQKYLKVK